MASRHTRVFVTDPVYMEDRAGGLVSAHASRVPQALAQIREWHPEFQDASDDEIARAPFGMDAARLVYARQHGFEAWEEFTAGLSDIAGGKRPEPFRDAFEALRQCRWGEFHALVAAHRDLLHARGTNGNTLLNLAVSLAGAEAIRILDLFLDGGADVNQANERGWTPLHQAGYGNMAELAKRLLAAGATPDGEAYGSGGTPLAMALFWGHRETADVLAEAMVAPRNLRIAAGLGREDLIGECFDAEGNLTSAALQGRGFYRPHSGFPVWQPSDDPQEVLNEALVWACKSDRVEVLEMLVQCGADMNVDVYRGTPLMWAVCKNRPAAARWLLEHGAVAGRATFGGLSHGQGITPLHLAAQNDFVEMAQLLLDFGVDTGIEDENYHSTAAGWANHFGSRRVAQLLAHPERKLDDGAETRCGD